MRQHLAHIEAGLRALHVLHSTLQLLLVQHAPVLTELHFIHAITLSCLSHADVKTEAGADGDVVRQQLAHIEAGLRALHEPNSAPHALLVEALARLESLAADLHIESGLMLEYAAQVCPCLVRLLSGNQLEHNSSASHSPAY